MQRSASARPSQTQVPYQSEPANAHASDTIVQRTEQRRNIMPIYLG